MEQENIHSPADVDSKHMTVVLHASLACLDKKRKLQAEQLGIPLPKHMCADQSFVTRYSSLVDDQDDELETESGKGSNSFTGDVDCVMSGEAKVDLEYLKACPSNCPSTSSANLGTSWSKDALYSLESRSVTKSDSHRTERIHVSKECDFLDQNFGWHHSLSYEDQLLDFGNHVECSCSECGNENIETCTDKELEDMLYSNGVTPNDFVLSSGRWKVGQDTQEGAKKLTIDKEFEQYFGMLML